MIHKHFYVILRQAWIYLLAGKYCAKQEENDADEEKIKLVPEIFNRGYPLSYYSDYQNKHENYKKGKTQLVCKPLVRTGSNAEDKE